MGANQSNFKPSSSSSGGHGGGKSSPVPSIMELMKPDCLKSDNKKRKRQLAPEKKKNICNNYTKNTGIVGAAGSGTRMTTLEEWLLASPGHVNADHDYNIKGGELYVFRPSSRRIHPAASSSSSKLPPFSKAKDSFCLERLVKTEDQKSYEANLVVSDTSASMSCRSITQLSGNKAHKLKKKVSFRLPEEADIFIFYPSEEIITMDDSDIDEDFD